MTPRASLEREEKDIGTRRSYSRATVEQDRLDGERLFPDQSVEVPASV
jgi:hypothetical protein